ncbi:MULTISPECIES: hypothetical protein [unclassified Chelatococcus]|uniref:hypothetical protein n=1 Tax=unclassified Chelatococcus TaxID=2638111 RepID=UPI001BCA7838|nr:MULTISPECIES: hypothetical protein [unclassified Chelatococcus]CAH1664221.1 conserved hypothetical protein [Hyphomicrobiales bacterium]MBS7741674.1 hypothetical protein [Chelatococcus sp. HY11]MBX3544307.1 hypothetical protein [Chelatococcus sp.]MCO5079169.1 hypothetical protein [Chelatococcus sp.]CAH1681893.1 conserved hypothetical protein [Hyphomicrobiales bacterium]
MLRSVNRGPFGPRFISRGLRLALTLVLGGALASCGGYGAGFAALPEASGWERLPVGRWLVEGIAPDTMVVCRRPACSEDAMVASFRLPDRLDGGADALRKAIFPNGFPRSAETGQRQGAKAAPVKSHDEVRTLEGAPFTGLVVTMRATTAPNRRVVAVIAERPRGSGMEVVLSIAATEIAARTNALKALGAIR